MASLVSKHVSSNKTSSFSSAIRCNNIKLNASYTENSYLFSILQSLLNISFHPILKPYDIWS